MKKHFGQTFSPAICVCVGWLGLQLDGGVCHTKNNQVLQLVPHPPRHLLTRVKSYLRTSQVCQHLLMWRQSLHGCEAATPFPSRTQWVRTAGLSGCCCFTEIVVIHHDQAIFLPYAYPVVDATKWPSLPSNPIASSVASRHIGCSHHHWRGINPCRRLPSMQAVKIGLVTMYVAIIWWRTWIYSASIRMPHSSRAPFVFG